MERIPARNIDTEKLLSDNDTFCMLPWIHIHMTPDTTVLPCCIGNFKYKNVIPGGLSIEDTMNTDFMKELRLNMLSGRRTAMCKTCYKAEKTGTSFRQEANKNYGQYIDEVIENTGADGTLHNFKMRYYDIRFSNVCNFKCRSCNSGYSSMWEAEDIKNNLDRSGVKKHKNISGLVDEILHHIPYVDSAYFAGGEPLITEEHYVILEELIRQKRTDVQLSYNTNLSNLNFKNHDIVELWKNFKKPIELYASLDHYGSRAEYIRSGTVWSDVEENIRTVKKLDNVKYCITSTVTSLNYVTLGDMFSYFMENGLWPDGAWQLNPVWDPRYFSPASLPEHLKQQGTDKLRTVVKQCARSLGIEKSGQAMLDLVLEFPDIPHSEDLWLTVKKDFLAEISRVDEIRNENFIDVFPELEEMVF